METSKKQILIRSKKIIQMMTKLVETGEKDDQVQLAVLCDKEYGNFDYNFIIELWKSNYRLRTIDLIRKLKYYLSDDDINFYAKVLYLEFIKKFQINTFGFNDMPRINQVAFGCSKVDYNNRMGSLIQFYVANIKPSNFVDTEGKDSVNIINAKENDEVLKKFLHSNTTLK